MAELVGLAAHSDNKLSVADIDIVEIVGGAVRIPAVKAMAVVGNDRVQARAEKMGVQFLDGQVDAGLSFALGVEEVAFHAAGAFRRRSTLDCSASIWRHLDRSTGRAPTSSSP